MPNMIKRVAKADPDGANTRWTPNRLKRFGDSANETETPRPILCNQSQHRANSTKMPTDLPKATDLTPLAEHRGR